MMMVIIIMSSQETALITILSFQKHLRPPWPLAWSGHYREASLNIFCPLRALYENGRIISPFIASISYLGHHQDII